MGKNSLENDIKKDNKSKMRFFNSNNSLADFIIPFISDVNPLGKLNDLYLKFLMFKHNCSLDVINNNFSYVINDSSELLKLANEMRDLYLKMIQVAFSKSDLSDEDSQKLELEIRKSLPSIVWKGPNKMGKTLVEDFETIEVKDKISNKEYKLEKLNIYLAKHLRGIITFELIEAFDCSNKKEPIGFKYFGKCPVCNRFFIKTSKNKIFCSDSCSAIKRGRNYRNKNK